LVTRRRRSTSRRRRLNSQFGKEVLSCIKMSSAGDLDGFGDAADDSLMDHQIRF
jgi:hypothetical protein